MASGELFFTSVAVIDGEEEAAPDASGDLLHVVLCGQRGFEAFVGFGVDRVAVEEFQFLGRRLCPSLDESAFVCVDAQRALWAQDFDREGVEEFVGEDDGGTLRLDDLPRIERAKYCFSGCEMISRVSVIRSRKAGELSTRM